MSSNVSLVFSLNRQGLNVACSQDVPGVCQEEALAVIQDSSKVLKELMRLSQTRKFSVDGPIEGMNSANIQHICEAANARLKSKAKLDGLPDRTTAIAEAALKAPLDHLANPRKSHHIERKAARQLCRAQRHYEQKLAKAEQEYKQVKESTQLKLHF